MNFSLLLLTIGLSCAHGFLVSSSTPKRVRSLLHSRLRASSPKWEPPSVFAFDPLGLEKAQNGEDKHTYVSNAIAPFAFPVFVAGALFSGSGPAEAAFASASNAVPSALAAYGHYLGLVLVCLALATERLTIKPDMTPEEEERFGNADIVYGLAGTLVLYTGYLRATEYGKGFDFYAHSPVFWVKMLLFSVMGSSSLFPTIKIIQRLVARKNGDDVEPMSEKLAARMTKVINGELLAIGSIPLAAALMARGVGYTDSLTWQVGAAPVVLVTVGLGAKYVKEALDWQED